jgi:hypothetical protein
VTAIGPARKARFDRPSKDSVLSIKKQLLETKRLGERRPGSSVDGYQSISVANPAGLHEKKSTLLSRRTACDAARAAAGQ